MAHLYSDFDTVYADQCSNWLSARGSWTTYKNQIGYADTAWGVGNDTVAIGHLIDAGRTMGFLCQFMFDFVATAADQSVFMECFYWAGQSGEAAEFNMDILLSTMVGASHNQLENFIGLVDAYRQSLWNKPFNVELFAALARGFEE